MSEVPYDCGGLGCGFQPCICGPNDPKQTAKLTANDLQYLRSTITDPATFCRWWQLRNLPNDRGVLKAAAEAGLISIGGGMISLTSAGHAIRDGHQRKMRDASRRMEIEAELKELDR